MQLCYEFSKKYFDLSLTLNSMSMANAEKSLEYTKILFFWSKYWANVKQLWALEQGPDPSFFLKSVLVMLVKHSSKEKVKKKLFLILLKTLHQEKIERNLDKESLVWVKDIFRERENKCCLYAWLEPAVRRMIFKIVVNSLQYMFFSKKTIFFLPESQFS